MSACHTVVPVRDASQIGEARRAAARIAGETLLNEPDRGKVTIVATEMATNLQRHGTDGRLLIRSMSHGVEMFAIDRGPGMANVDRCFEDGYSTSGTPGTGLGAIRRLSSEFDVYSAQPAGTVIFSRILNEPPRPGEHAVQCGAVCVAAPGETDCGDNWSLVATDGQAAFMIADGLGHGSPAAEASGEAVRVFEAQSQRPTAFLQAAHQRLRSTRGAAVAAAHIDFQNQKLLYAGFGNVCGFVFASGGVESRGLMSHNGTLGLQIRPMRDVEYDWPPRGFLIMHSDGLQTRWDITAYPGLAQRHPAVIAAVLFRDFTRGRDDVTVAVVR